MGDTKQHGYIALMAVLIVGAAATAIAVGLLVAGTDSQRTSLVIQQSAQARGLAAACGEEALQQIHDNTAFTGTGNLTQGQGTCTYTVTNAGGNNRTIDASGTVGGAIRKLQISATVGATAITITSWQEVASSTPLQFRAHKVMA